MLCRIKVVSGEYVVNLNSLSVDLACKMIPERVIGGGGYNLQRYLFYRVDERYQPGMKMN